MAPTYANPLLVEWIKEMYDLARERNTKSVNGYKRAYESIKACPMRLDHPSHAQELAGIGPKICGILTEKMEEYREANGLSPLKKRRSKLSKRPVDEDTAEAEPSAPAKKPRKAKPYVPALKSGAYAIILGLSSLPEDSLESLGKKELIDLAQPHCESSFTEASHANKCYTAWSSMKTLLSKDLVHERRGPCKKYALTDEGWQVARRMKKAQEDDKINQTLKITAEEKPDTLCATNTHGIVGDGDNFLDLEDDDSGLENIADMTARPSCPDILGKDNVKKGSEAIGQELGRMSEDKYGTSAKQKATGSKTASAREPPRSVQRNVIDLSSSPEPQPEPDIPWTSASFSQDVRTLAPQSVPHHNVPPSPKTLQPMTEKPRQQSIQPAAANTPLAVMSDGLPQFTPTEISPGTFTVELVLDNREIRSKDKRDYIADELTKKGVTPLTRSLEVGDFFWVAKLKSNTLLRQHNEEGDEIALDWIVERKRLDDFLGSIHDGRFVEQKFRLRRSGAKNVIYLIEEFSMDSAVVDKFRDSMQTSIASTQILNGYFVKQTKKLDDTIRYLARMTRMLKSLYESKPLYLIPTSALTATSYLPLLKHLRTDPAHADRSYHITYPSFASLASKSNSLTLRDVFLKMLMCTRGISGDKALAIQKHWQTPRAFIEASENCETKKQREGLVESKLGNNPGRGKVKGILGAKVAQIWGEE